ncbi:uncharacterized protein LOC124416313 [Diprion similis]|uniref:uncharacterized protein LOC124416313 n=1 Tax=Diprion similis TaxID=362088 RepID=UPI001EF9335F|nr:uncharacterized protein LOC124416313 [Diprion similis]
MTQHFVCVQIIGNISFLVITPAAVFQKFVKHNHAICSKRITHVTAHRIEMNSDVKEGKRRKNKKRNKKKIDCNANNTEKCNENRYNQCAYVGPNHRCMHWNEYSESVNFYLKVSLIPSILILLWINNYVPFGESIFGKITTFTVFVHVMNSVIYTHCGIYICEWQVLRRGDKAVRCLAPGIPLHARVIILVVSCAQVVTLISYFSYPVMTWLLLNVLHLSPCYLFYNSKVIKLFYYIDFIRNI